MSWHPVSGLVRFRWLANPWTGIIAQHRAYDYLQGEYGALQS